MHAILSCNVKGALRKRAFDADKNRYVKELTFGSFPTVAPESAGQPV